MLLLMLMTNVYVSIIWDLIFFASGVQALRKLTYINLMVLEMLENEVLDLLSLSLQAQLVGCRRIKTIAITSRIEGNKKNPFLYSLTKLKHSLLTLHSGMRHFTMHRRTLSSGLLLFRSKGGKTEGAFNEGLPGVFGNKRTLAKYGREH